MDAAELLRIVDSIHREKKIDKEIIIAGIESGLLTAAKKYYGDDCDVQVHIDPSTGQIAASHNGIPMPAEEISQRIGAQTAKQVMIQKIREAERDTLFDEFKSQLDEMVTGKVHKIERGTAIVQLGAIEAILPPCEMIPKESLQLRKFANKAPASRLSSAEFARIWLNASLRKTFRKLPKALSKSRESAENPAIAAKSPLSVKTRELTALVPA